MHETAAQAFGQAGLRLVIVERPGIELSDLAPTDRWETAIDDAKAVVDHFGARKIIGLSFSGGAFPLAGLIAKYPEFFERAAFISPRAFKATPQESEEIQSIIDMFSGLPVKAGQLTNEAKQE